jgi:hypothetical protein
MGCVLRASGRKLNVDSLARRTSFRVLAVHRRGEPRSKARPDGRVNTRSSCNILVSNRGFDEFHLQVRDAVRFLKRKHRELRRLRRQSGLEELVLDFGVEPTHALCNFYPVPLALVELAGRSGMSLEISTYAKENAWQAWARGREVGRSPKKRRSRRTRS